ncbi:MAG TPA: carbon monoxide dehydrogenase subunit G [Anaerolineales bacterium]|nr:carbon monoxide dehydrogenase subunit G [Anaerolineales bacterium]
MYFEGTVNINAPREKVYKFLTDPNFVAQCAPGVKEMAVIVPNEKYQAVAVVGFGSVSAEFRTDVEFLEFVPIDRAKVKAHGNAPGSAVDAISEMFLSDSENGTTDLKWTADIAVVGTIASVAARLMGPVTKKLTGMFFECVKGKIEG